MKFIQAVHESLALCTSTVTLLGANKIFQSYVPIATAMPYLVVGGVSDEFLSPTLGGNTDTLRKASIPISIVSTTVGQSAGIADKLRVELYNSSGILATSGITVKNIHISTMSYEWDPGQDGSETGAHVCIVNLIFIYVSSTPNPVDLSGI